MEKLLGGKADYSEDALKDVLGPGWKEITDNLLSIGFLSRGKKHNDPVYSISFFVSTRNEPYQRKCLGRKQG